MIDRSYVILEKEGPIARIIMNRPERLNPLGRPMMDAIEETLKELDKDDEVKVIIIKGAGRAFSSGHDVAEIGMDIQLGPEYAGKRPTAKILIDRDRRLKRNFYEYIFNYPKPIIAQVHGYCIAGANNLQMVCDITIAADDTNFGGGGGRERKGTPVIIIANYLPNNVWTFGKGGGMNGKDAERRGIINKAVPLDKLEAEVENIAKAIAHIPSNSLDLNKGFLNGMLDFDGVQSAWRVTYHAHAMGTLQRLHPGEFNIFKERRDLGASAAIHKRVSQRQQLEQN